jgi:asparagine synthase (glutamine-hydrolysing)
MPSDFAMRLPVRFKLGRLSEVVRLLQHHGGRGGDGDMLTPNTRLEEYVRNPRDGKLLLRQAMSRFLPQDITSAGKQGFSAPDATWFRRESLDYVHTLSVPNRASAHFWITTLCTPCWMTMRQVR